MSIQELQQKLLTIISNIIIESDDSSIETMQKEALEVINGLKDHINDEVEYNSQKMTVLDYTIFFDTQGYNSNNPTRVNNPALLELERVIRDAGGKTSQELGRNADRSSADQGDNADRPSTRLENVTIEPVMRNNRHLVA